MQERYSNSQIYSPSSYIGFSLLSIHCLAKCSHALKELKVYIYAALVIWNIKFGPNIPFGFNDFVRKDIVLQRDTSVLISK